MGMMKEFKAFAMRGNVVDMAVGIVIGGAFGKIVSSLVEKIIMPIASYLTAGADVSGLSTTLPAAIEGQQPAVIGYGHFIQTVIDFVIVAFAIFLVIKAMNKIKKKEEETPPAPPKPSQEVLLLTQIRDSLAKP